MDNSRKNLSVKEIQSTWLVPTDLVARTKMFDNASILKMVDELLQEVPMGGNIQVTVSPIESQETSIGTERTAKIIMNYFE